MNAIPRPDTPHPSDLLALCAVLRHFDRDTLLELSADAAAVAALLTGAAVEPAPQAPGMLQLRPEARAAALDQLNAERPDAAILLNERALEHYLGRMARPAARRPDDEAGCFHHLEALRTPLIERREWARMGRHIAAARAAAPREPHHRHLLALYEGVNAVRTQRYPEGEAALQALLADAAAAPEIHMRALNVLAQSSWFQTRYDRALEHYRQAGAIAATLGNATFQAHTLLNMSLVYHEIGYYAQALSLSEQSLAAYVALGDAYHEGHARYEVAKNALQLGRWDEAREQFAASGAIYSRLGIVAQLANLYALQAILAHAQGDLAASEELYGRSLAIGVSAEHGDPAVTMDSRLLLGLLYQTQARWDEALAAYAQADQLARELQNPHARALAAFRRGDIERARGRPAAADAAYFHALDLVESLRGSTTVEEVKLGLLGATQQIYEATVLHLVEQGRHAEAYAVAERARAQAFLDLLAQKSPELYAAFEQPAATLAEVQALLPPDALLVEYYTTGVLPPGEHLAHQLKRANRPLFEHLVAPPRVLIFAITHDGFALHAASVDPNLFAPGPDELRPGQRWLQERRLRALYDQLIAPLAAELAGRRQLFLIPHGPLHHVPFLALRSPDGRYLLDSAGPAVALAPSATVLVRSCLGPRRAAAGGMLALGYNDPALGLQHAEDEARAAAAIMGGAALTGPDPKSAALFAAAPGLRAVHIAGHAVFHPYDPLGSYLSLGAGDQLSARAVMHQLSLDHGLVSLSACTSGLAHVAPGDELLGMLRAWLYAGATTVVCALWEASDIVARLVMEHFYTALSDGRSPGAAFRDAVAAVRQLSGRDLAAIFERWRAAGPGQPLPEINRSQYDQQPYADPRVWASFMLVGRM